MSARPAVALALHPVLCEGQLGGDVLERLERVADLIDPEPLVDLHDRRAVDALGRCDALITSWGCGPLDAAVLAHAPALRLIAHAAGTVKGHVTPACFDRDIRVTSAAWANALPVAEYTLAAILFANKRVLPIARRYAELREGRLWSREVPGLGNFRKRVGVIGASHVGRRVLELLAPFEIERVLHDPTIDGASAEALGATALPLDELLATSDVVTLHAPLLPNTTGLIDASRLARMRDGATLINTARGAIVDGAALEAELVAGRLHAVLDTTEPEVLPPGSPLYTLPNVLLTPHIAGALGDETQRMMHAAIDEVERLARGEAPRHPVIRADWDRIA